MMSYLHAWKSSGEVFSNSDAIAPWWSITKTVIAVSSLKLWEAGDLDLDEPLPSHPFTLRQLLKHTAGVPNYGRFTRPIIMQYPAKRRRGPLKSFCQS